MEIKEGSNVKKDEDFLRVYINSVPTCNTHLVI